jgi:hypothetical protein
MTLGSLEKACCVGSFPIPDMDTSDAGLGSRFVAASDGTTAELCIPRMARLARSGGACRGRP